MEGYRNFVVTMDHASDYCSQWENVETGEELSYAEMMIVAAYLDRDYPLNEDSWYIVVPDGEICMWDEGFEEIMPLFKPLNKKGIEEKFTGDEFFLPQKKDNASSYCMYCGTKLKKDAVYCPNCGKKVD